MAWCVSGVNNVTEGFGEEISKELSFRYAVISSRELFMLTSMSRMMTPEAHTIRLLLYALFNHPRR